MLGSALPDVGAIWAYLAEPADFFGLAMPPLDDLTAAVSAFAATFPEDAALVATDVTISEVNRLPEILVTGSAVAPRRGDAVRIDGPRTPPLHQASDPWWRRMAARTTSRGELDQCQRWLNGRGFADGVSKVGRPLLGALVFEYDGAVVGVEDSEPTSVLDQMAQCGAIDEIDRVDECRTIADRVWWVSPRYRTHPVEELDGTAFPVDGDAVPPLARWS